MRRARARPSEAGSIPAIATMRSDFDRRSTLIIRSVPMLPDPITATPVFIAAPSETGPDRAEARDARLVGRARRHRHHRPERAGQHHVTGPQRAARAGERLREPGHGVRRVAQAGRARADGDRLAVVFEHRPAEPEIHVGDPPGAGAEHEQAAGGVVGDGVHDGDVPVRHPRADDLDGRQQVVGRADHVHHRHLLVRQVRAEHERDLRLHPGLEHPAGATSAPSGTAMSANSTPKSGW